jgi:hypothetical protein
MVQSVRLHAPPMATVPVIHDVGVHLPAQQRSLVLAQLP